MTVSENLAILESLHQDMAQASGATTIYLTDAEDVTHYDVPLTDAQAIFLEMTTAFAEAHAKKQLLR